jgi:diaminopimelate decarboxylase
MGDSREFSYRLFGPTCRPQDVICPVKRLPLLEIGDVIAIMDAGAYWIPSQSNFSFPRATAVLVENRGHKLIRKKESYEHMVALDFLS